MEFLNRRHELARLLRLAHSPEGGLAVLYGRRRVGKTRLLLEWARRLDGLYTVADQSAPEIQRRYFAEAVAERLEGFAEVDYPDWRTLLARLARAAQAAQWRGPVIFDELPYLVTTSPELPSILQRWIDHDARDARLSVAVAGSSQRMMQGLVLDAQAPLYGRAREILDLGPIDAVHLTEVFPERCKREIVEIWAAWGGVPRYWELAAEIGGSVFEQLEHLVLDPLGPLHREPDRLLIEEIPSAMEARPVLDAIGSGAHRLSEISGRVGRPATSMWRPIDRLRGMGLVRRETPFGESEKKSRRALYKIDDPFVRLWFRVVAPHRALLAGSPPATRRHLLDRRWDQLVAQAWEDLCRIRVPYLFDLIEGPWGPAARWWKGNLPEWDVVSEALSGEYLLLGEVKWSTRSFDLETLTRLAKALRQKPRPPLNGRLAKLPDIRVLFVPQIEDPTVRVHDGVIVLTADDVLGGSGPELKARADGRPKPT